MERRIWNRLDSGGKVIFTDHAAVLHAPSIIIHVSKSKECDIITCNAAHEYT